MKESDLMIRDGLLFTDEQYKKCFRFIIVSLVFSGAITLIGAFIAILATKGDIVVTGVIVGGLGFVLLMISLISALKKSSKIQLYRHFKKHPEDFDSQIN